MSEAAPRPRPAFRRRKPPKRSFPSPYKLPNKMRPHGEQSRAWREDRRFACVAAGRRSGKTEMGVVRMLRKAIEPKPWDDPRFGFGAPTRSQAKRIYWRRLKASIAPEWIRDISESELRIDLINGAELWVVGMDKPERVEGTPWDEWLLDEFANMKPEAWEENIRPALADRRGGCWKIGVPQGRNHFWKLAQEYQAPAMRAEAGFYTWKSTSVVPHTHTPASWRKEIASLRASLDERSFRQEMEASFEEASGRIYYSFDRELDVHDFAMPAGLGQGIPWRGGIDFNVSPMCAVYGWEVELRTKAGPETHVFVWDELWLESNANTLAAGRIIQQRAAEFRGTPEAGEFVMYPDASGDHRDTRGNSTDHSLLRQAGFSVRAKSSNPSLRDRYNAVNSMFLNGAGRRRVHIHPRCTQLIRCLEGILYADGSNEPDKKKCKDMEHVTDALGYWVENRHPVQYGAHESFDIQDIV